MTMKMHYVHEETHDKLLFLLLHFPRSSSSFCLLPPSSLSSISSSFSFFLLFLLPLFLLLSFLIFFLSFTFTSSSSFFPFSLLLPALLYDITFTLIMHRASIINLQKVNLGRWCKCFCLSLASSPSQNMAARHKLVFDITTSSQITIDNILCFILQAVHPWISYKIRIVGKKAWIHTIHRYDCTSIMYYTNSCYVRHCNSHFTSMD